MPIYSYADTGILEVNSNPSGAKVYIDVIYVGETPYQNLEIPTGKHKIKSVLSDDYPAQYREIVIDEISPQIINFSFESGEGGEFIGEEIEQKIEIHKGNVTFASIPSRAIVFINGEKKKSTPIGYKDVDVGRYSVEFNLDGRSLKGHFDIIKGETVKLIADFNKMRIINNWYQFIFK
ncbi:MAG: PEGA domain-containing protein [Candidatus Hodarchaeales archaeon]|jgi:hypothetical protein